MSPVRDQIFKTIIKSGRAAISPREICETIQCPPSVVEECLSDLEADDMIATWESDKGILVTLSPLAAERLDVRLVEYEYKTFWMEKGRQERAPAIWATDLPLDDYKDIVDKTPSPDVQLTLSEEIGTISVMPEGIRKTLPKKDWRGEQRFDQFYLPYPTSFLGVGTALWDNMKYDICPGCKGKELERYEYCLRCDRWGMDPYLEKSSDRINIRAYVERKVKSVNVVKRVENGKRQRKDKHRQRMVAKSNP